MCESASYNANEIHSLQSEQQDNQAVQVQYPPLTPSTVTAGSVYIGQIAFSICHSL
ncbi:UNVERIFIED_CONTAM: hypothetical protein FKN15_008426 [Acipenser sinensis]